MRESGERVGRREERRESVSDEMRNNALSDSWVEFGSWEELKFVGVVLLLLLVMMMIFLPSTMMRQTTMKSIKLIGLIEI